MNGPHSLKRHAGQPNVSDAPVSLTRASRNSEPARAVAMPPEPHARTIALLSRMDDDRCSSTFEDVRDDVPEWDRPEDMEAPESTRTPGSGAATGPAAPQDSLPWLSSTSRALTNYRFLGRLKDLEGETAKALKFGGMWYPRSQMANVNGLDGLEFWAKKWIRSEKRKSR